MSTDGGPKLTGQVLARNRPTHAGRRRLGMVTARLSLSPAAVAPGWRDALWWRATQKLVADGFGGRWQHPHMNWACLSDSSFGLLPGLALFDVGVRGGGRRHPDGCGGAATLVSRTPRLTIGVRSLRQPAESA